MNNIKFWRIERRLTQIELAAASGLGRWAVQLFEEGIRQPSSEEIQAIAEALGISPKDLRDRDEN